MYFYAIFRGRKTGIFTKWTECFPLINKYPGAIYKKFNNKIEAELFIKNNNDKHKENNKEEYKQKENNKEEYKQKENNKEEYKQKEDTKEEEDDNKEILFIYTDGSCINNGRENASGGIGIHFSDTKYLDISKKIKINEGDSKITNQKMELIAINEALKFIVNFKNLHKEIILYTDSQYSLDCILKYSIQWIKNDWKTSTNKDVKHKEIIINILDLYSKFNNLIFKHINSHTGLKDKHSIGNSMADILALKGSKNFKK